METSILMRVLASSVNLAARASTIVRNVLASKDLEIVDKGVNDLQSKADRDAQRCIVGSLTQTFPGLKVIGEEGTLDNNGLATTADLDVEVMKHQCPDAYKSVNLLDMVVWVDPLDGTMEFTEGLIEYVTVLIGVAVDGKPVAGVIAQPFFHPDKTKPDEPAVVTNTVTRIIWGMDGLGVFGINPKKPEGALPYPLNPNISKGDHPHVIVTTRSHATSKLASAIEACAPTEILRAGGCGYKVLMLLEGAGHLYLFPSAGAKRWDTCAPEAVLTAAGGALTDLRGNHYDYRGIGDPMDRGGIMATPVADWIRVYTPLMPKEVLDSLTFF
ncbi:Bisphosphate nucleotidase 1 [Fasciolopsis buskii]|uniref:3'(2'),5'-bisphosphate nucleotidase 1 n=1 Tax=Fasciolopsis buskii TaxID=27845 RepID=A0A8E0VI52_9TREM|nr:Bisphosphate nucleotidase 1 [Fasciolopsis buski]